MEFLCPPNPLWTNTLENIKNGQTNLSTPKTVDRRRFATSRHGKGSSAAARSTQWSAYGLSGIIDELAAM